MALDERVRGVAVGLRVRAGDRNGSLADLTWRSGPGRVRSLMAEASTIVCILGMHRSGTSCLAGSLEEAGLYLGDVITNTPHNLKGTRENRRIFTLHDGILGRCGGTWQHPPERIDWTDSDRAAPAGRSAIWWISTPSWIPRNSRQPRTEGCPISELAPTFSTFEYETRL